MIGLPGDKIKIINGQIFINNKLILRKKTNDFIDKDNNGNTKRLKKIQRVFL